MCSNECLGVPGLAVKHMLGSIRSTKYAYGGSGVLRYKDESDTVPKLKKFIVQREKTANYKII